MGYSFGKTVDLGFDEAIDRATACLKEEGFGILSEIDIAAAMKQSPAASYFSCKPTYKPAAKLTSPTRRRQRTVHPT